MIKLPPEYHERTVVALLRANALFNPKKTAIIGSSGFGYKLRITYAELDKWTNKLANGLKELGVRKGEKVAIMLNNSASAEAILTLFAVHKIGAINVPINTQFVVSELEYIFGHSEAGILVMGADFIPVINQIRNTLGFVRNYIIVGQHSPSFGYSFSSVMNSGWEDDLEESITEDDDADLIYISGITGQLKGILFTHGSTVFSAIAIGAALSLCENDIYQTGVPFFSSAGCHFHLMASLVNGCTFISESGFHVESTLVTIQQEGTSVFYAIPASYDMLLDSGRINDYDVRSLRVFNYGGAPMPPSHIRRIHEAFPGVELIQTYGLTETGPTRTYLPGEFSL